MSPARTTARSLANSNQRGYARSPWLSVGVVALSVVAVPYYFFRSRGARGGFIALGLFLICLLFFGVLSTAGQYTTYYGVQT
jgi:hypothetical protein